jgi:hypothetical protein
LAVVVMLERLVTGMLLLVIGLLLRVVVQTQQAVQAHLLAVVGLMVYRFLEIL